MSGHTAFWSILLIVDFVIGYVLMRALVGISALSGIAILQEKMFWVGIGTLLIVIVLIVFSTVNLVQS